MLREIICKSVHKYLNAFALVVFEYFYIRMTLYRVQYSPIVKGKKEISPIGYFHRNINKIYISKIG